MFFDNVSAGEQKFILNFPLKNILLRHTFEEGELQENVVMRKFGISEFSTKPTNFYNLDVIISVEKEFEKYQQQQRLIEKEHSMKELEEDIKKISKDIME